MLSDFHIITITHNDLNVNEIGHFVIKNNGKEALKSKLHLLKEEFKIKEFLYLTTCNRVAYICYNNDIWGSERLSKFFKFINPELTESQLSKLPKFVKVYNGEDAINHLFEVSASIDSLVVGEREIFRQFREAYHSCKEFGLMGDNFRLLENYTVKAAKQVYAETKIGEKPLSIVSLAMQKLLSKNVPTSSKILIVGAGETNQLMAKFLLKYGFHNAIIFNRNLDNADEISQLLKAPAYHLSELKNHKTGFDIIIVSTGATSALINVNIYKGLIQKETSEKLIIDLSVPRNVEEEVVQNFPIDYVDIEQLRSLAEINLESRKKEIIQARKILKSVLKEFTKRIQERQIEKAMKKVPGQIRAVKEKAINSVFEKEINNLDDDSRKLLLNMMDYMEKKCVSIPMKLAKDVVKS